MSTWCFQQYKWRKGYLPQAEGFDEEEEEEDDDDDDDDDDVYILSISLRHGDVTKDMYLKPNVTLEKSTI